MNVYSEATSTVTRKVVASNTEFAMELYGKLRTSEGNLFFSPYSVSTALAMAWGGASGDTAKQMGRTLPFDLRQERIHSSFAELEANFREIRQKGQVQFVVANSIWPQKSYELMPDFLGLCRKYYETSITRLDYVEHTEASRKTINDWVETQTNHKIVELLKPEALNRSTRLLLVNSIYFKGNWSDPFEARLTKDELFTLSSGKSVSAPLMRRIDKFSYAEFQELQVLQMPYAGGDLSMLILLPRETNGLAQLEAMLNKQQLSTWTGNLQTREVDVCLPKIKISSQLSLGNSLAALGMPDAFNSRADFSGMDGKKDLFINEIIQEAFIEVNEKGTEAVAATVGPVYMFAIPSNPLPAAIFRADHPFLFLIRDNRYGNVLFFGRLMDPTK